MHAKILGLTGALALLLIAAIASGDAPALSRGPVYTADGRMVLPDDYRTWVYLSSGFDMSYSAEKHGDHHVFDNVFAEPGAYREFLKTGTWPDKTMLVLEARGALDAGSINKRGNYQGTEVLGREVHVKDSARFKDQWAFFGFEGAQPADMIPHSASCYSCHAAHGAVDNTFVQFYPTLLPIARAKETLSAAYRLDEAR
jgi:Cytochrome P460